MTAPDAAQAPAPDPITWNPSQATPGLDMAKKKAWQKSSFWFLVGSSLAVLLNQSGAIGQQINPILAGGIVAAFWTFCISHDWRQAAGVLMYYKFQIKPPGAGNE